MFLYYFVFALCGDSVGIRFALGMGLLVFRLRWTRYTRRKRKGGREREEREKERDERTTNDESNERKRNGGTRRESAERETRVI